MPGWSHDEKLFEVLRGPIGMHLLRADSRIEEREGWYRVVTPSARDGTLNEVVLSQLSHAEADAEIDRVVGEQRALGAPFRWQVGPDATPADLGARLEARGLVPWPTRAMALDPRTLSGAPRGDVIEVGPDDLDAFVDVIARGWSLDRAAERARFGAALARPDRRHHLFLARVDGAAVGAAALVVRPRSAYLIGGVIVPEARGRGAYRALVEARVRWAARAGLTLATTQAIEGTSAPILEHLGWETICRFAKYAPPRT